MPMPVSTYCLRLVPTKNAPLYANVTRRLLVAILGEIQVGAAGLRREA